ncbi:hypothetical protein A1O1_06227 [Capronia coronata CBS 617.96]|uniref:Transcription factor domain-containing protein n=1 Tax=Capronia coronata CBS 617.96 TaxID=1182541 RepID=W9Y081_9EURO|nr:uncharacterized protein A1O1_06227 [Capronia coronata CBS 617.96]EXJ85858.1 hypothetical protein A1O1_06227 [Capronia coronata CBS 617.96]
MKASKFMFINKDAQSESLSHSNRHERISIHSHVQKCQRYKKAEGRVSHATPLRLLQPGNRSGNPGHRPEQSGDDVLTASEQSTAPKHNAGHVHVAPWEMSPINGPKQTSPHIIPVFPASAEESFDPFDVTCITVDAAVHSLLQYFLRVHHPNIWHIERAVRLDHQYTFRSDAMSIVQGCLHDQYNMYALLASMASYMTYIDGIPSPADGTYYIHKALKASQEYVHSRQPITGRMVFNIFNLGCAEWYRYNVDAAYVHLKAAKSMVDSMGGLKILDGPLIDLLLTGDGYVAAELRAKPLWSASDFEPGDDHPMTTYGICELRKLLSGRVKIAAGLLTPTQQDIVPADLRWIILDLAVALSVLRASQSSDRAADKPPSDSLHWVHIRTLTIRHRLLSMQLDDPRSGALRTALVLWIFLIFTVSGRKRSIKIIAPFLRETLLSIADELWAGHEEVQLWILSVGSFCAAPDSEDHRWFVDEVANRLTGALDDLDTISELLRAQSQKFFYLEPAQSSVLQTLAEDIHKRRVPGKGDTSRYGTAFKAM